MLFFNFFDNILCARKKETERVTLDTGHSVLDVHGPRWGFKSVSYINPSASKLVYVCTYATHIHSKPTWGTRRSIELIIMSHRLARAAGSNISSPQDSRIPSSAATQPSRSERRQSDQKCVGRCVGTPQRTISDHIIIVSSEWIKV